MKILAQSKTAAMTFALALGMSGLAFSAQTNTSPANNTVQSNSQSSQYSQTEVKSAQQKLKDDGYYNGNIDGQDGPETHAAIRKFQEAQHLKVNGMLDKQTCNKLGVQNQ